MTRKASTYTFDTIWQALRRPPGRKHVGDETARIAGMLDEEWVSSVDLGDLLEDHDGRLRGVAVTDLSTLLGVPATTVYSVGRRKTQSDFMGCDRYRLSDVAALMVRVERLGFDVDPTAMVAAPLPHQEGRRLLTDADLVVRHFAIERHRCADLSLGAEGGTPHRQEQFRTGSGYKVSGWFDGEDRLVQSPTSQGDPGSVGIGLNGPPAVPRSEFPRSRL